MLQNDLAVGSQVVHVDALLLLCLSDNRRKSRMRKQKVHGSVSSGVQHPVVREHVVCNWVLAQVKVLDCTVTNLLGSVRDFILSQRCLAFCKSDRKSVV